MEPAEGEPRIWLIAGPTASGKSALALRLAQAIGGEVVNADSMQLYRGLEILTAAPPRDDRLLAPHHLFGVADPADGWSVGRWLDAARRELDDIARWRRKAVVVGGTGLYFHALTKGLAEIPKVPREVVERLARDNGELSLRDRLARLDPEAEARIARGDLQRLLRAVAVAETTGRSLTAWQADTQPALEPGSWRALVLEPDRAALYARCDARLETMLETGAAEEVEALLARNLDPALPAMKAVGVREIGDWIAGRVTRAEALAAAQQATRNYAKRQMTWFRNQTPDWPRITGGDLETQWGQVLALAPSLTRPA